MKFLFVAAMLCTLVNANANNYYFSFSVGNDSYTNAQAQNSLTPWKSLSKLNSFFSSLKPGDSVLFKRGDTFYGSFTISVSGTSAKPIVLSAYGTGADPVITGFSNVTAWTNIGGNIWESSSAISSLSTCNMVVINGVNTAMGRYPNSGYLSFQSHGGNTSITSNALSGTPNWTGAEVVIRSNRYNLDRSKITSQSGGTLTFSSISNTPINNFGFFIQNDSRTLDQQNEWYYDPGTKKLRIYSSSIPANVQAATVDRLVAANGSYVTFNGLSFSGANTYAFTADVSMTGLSVLNSSISYCGNDAVYLAGSSHFTLLNSTISNVNNSAVNLYYANSYPTIRNNTIINTAIFPGMGQTNAGRYTAVLSTGKNLIFEYNTIKNTGYIPLNFAGDSLLIKNNFIDSFAFVLDDGGGIYTWNNSGTQTYHGIVVTGNIILNGIGAGNGTNDPTSLAAEGIYADDNSSNIVYSDNTIAHCANDGIFLHNAHEIELRNNTCFNNYTQLRAAHDNISVNAPIRNIMMYRNKFFSRLPDQDVFKFSTISNDISVFGTADSNYYARPLDDDYIFLTKPYPAIDPGLGLDLTKWKSTYNKDPHSKRSPKRITEYTLNALSGTNKISNGTFSSNIGGASCWNPSGSCTLSWDNTGQINGGSLKLSYSTASNGNTIVVINIGSVSASKNYILRYSIKGTKPSLSVGAYLRQTNSPWSNISPTKYSLANNTVVNQEVLFSSPTTESNASLVFQFNDVDGSFWLDNIELYEANVTITRPDDYIRFEYNAGKTNKVVALNGTYISADSTVYTNTVTLAPFSSVILLKETTQPLPLTFLSFDGKRTGNKIELEWRTANEVNTDYFDVLRSVDGIQFEKIGEVKANNTTGVFDYKATDDNPFPGKNYYKLKQVDLDGKYSFSKVITIAYLESTGISISPNPASNAIRVSLNIGACAGSADLFIHSVSGSLIKRMSVAVSSGAEILIDVSNLASGTYLLSLFCNNTTSTEKFVKQ